jgi:AcrR family transcriptional regulator
MPKGSEKPGQSALQKDTPTGKVNFRTRQAQVKRERMLARLLSATMEVCGDTGRRGAAVIDDVVRAAGVSRGAFYWYFNSLDEAVEALGRQLADEIIAETRTLFLDRDRPVVLRAALGGQVMLCRACMDKTWAGYLSNVHVLLDDSAFVSGVRRNLEVGRTEGVFRFASLTMAVDFQIGAVMGAIRRCTFEPTPPLTELVEINRLILTGLGVNAELAATTATDADAIVRQVGPQHLPWWRSPV